MSAETMLPAPQICDAVERIKGVFTDIPGTQLSVREVGRLSGLEPERCEPILEALVGVGFLAQSRHGRYRQAD
jgi:hypothetical protein